MHQGCEGRNSVCSGPRSFVPIIIGSYSGTSTILSESSTTDCTQVSTWKVSLHFWESTEMNQNTRNLAPETWRPAIKEINNTSLPDLPLYSKSRPHCLWGLYKHHEAQVREQCKITLSKVVARAVRIDEDQFMITDTDGHNELTLGCDDRGTESMELRLYQSNEDVGHQPHMYPFTIQHMNLR